MDILNIIYLDLLVILMKKVMIYF